MERAKLLCIHRFSHWHKIFPIDSLTVLEFLKEVVNELLELGMNLGLPLPVLKAIEKDFPNDTSMQRYELVSAWMSSSVEPPCWWHLVQALKTIDYSVMSAEIQKNYGE